MVKTYLKSGVISLAAMVVTIFALFLIERAITGKMTGLNAGAGASICFLILCSLCNVELNRKPFNNGGNNE